MKRHWPKAFLAALENTGSVTAAAESAGIHRTAAYQHRKTDKAFAQEWDDALDMAADQLEDIARARAFAGSDILLMFLLKGIRPQRWRESRATLPPAELNKMIEVELKRLAAAKNEELSEAVN